MKRFLSMVLALTMILSVLTTAAVVSADESGKEGEVTVFLRDFEDGVKRPQDAGSINSIADDGTGNKYGAVTLTAAGLANSPSVNGDRRTFVALAYRLKFNDTIPYISGKEYSWSWDLATVQGNVNPLGSGTSGVSSFGTTNRLVGYNGETATAYEQYYFGITAKTEKNGTVYAKHTNQNLESGWKRNTVTDFNYKLSTSATDSTAVADGTVGAMYGIFFEVDIKSTLLKLLADNKAYMGCGFGDGKVADNTFKFDDSLANSYSFTLTEDDVFGDEACLSDPKSQYYNDKDKLIGTTWHPGKDCTPLKSAKREAKFQKVIDSLNFAFGIDNVTIKAKAKLYDNTVTAGEHGSVKVTTTNGLGDADNTPTVVSGETKTVEVNDYYGTTYEVTPDDGYAVNKVTYGGEEVSLTDGKYTVAAADVAADKDFNVTFYKLPGVKVRSFYVSLKGGTAGDSVKVNGGTYGKYITSADGMLTVTTPNSNIGKLNNTNAEEGYFEWISARDSTQVKDEKGNVKEAARMYAFLPKTKVGSGRKIQLSFDFTNGGAGNFNMPYSQLTKMATSYYADGKIYGLNSCPWAAVGASEYYHHTYGPGAQLSGTVTPGGSLTVSTPVYDIAKFAKSSDNKTEYNDKVYQNLIQFDFVVPGCSDDATPRLHAVKFTETVPVYEITASQNDANGSVKLYSDSLNFGVDNDNMEIGKGTAAEVEHMMTAKFTVAAPSGKVIEKIEFVDNKGTATDYSAQAANESAAEISMTNVEIGGTLNVTYKEQAATEPTVSAGDFSAVTDGFAYTPADGGEAVTVTGKTSIITYAKIDNGTASISECGYYIAKLNDDGTVSGGEIKLAAIAVPEGLTYGIRAFGDALTAGKYSVQPYIVKEGGEEIKGDAKTLTIE